MFQKNFWYYPSNLSTLSKKNIEIIADMRKKHFEKVYRIISEILINDVATIIIDYAKMSRTIISYPKEKIDFYVK